MNRKNGSWRNFFTVVSVAMVAVLYSFPAVAEAGLTELTVEELMNIQVTSASRKPERLVETASAIYVISQEDIRRSGMTSIPELLRMVPGLDVAQYDANKWAISSRGFNNLFANKLMVLIDGRTAYSPLYSGVFWDVQDTPLEDIDRIEVIRGPGGTLWGANAVNGVINIMTRQSKDTQGGLAVAGGGTLEHNGETLRYGGTLGERTYYRVYGKQFDRTSFVDAAGNKSNDAWRQSRGGFRIDSAMRNGDALTLDGEAYSGFSGETTIVPALTPPYSNVFAENHTFDSNHLRANWHRPLEDSGEMSLQAYYDHALRRATLLSEKRDTYDLDFQHRLLWSDQQEAVWGLSYRQIFDEISTSTQFISFAPPSDTLRVYSAFLQNESRWLDGRLHFILGSKFEHNDVTGVETQPNARLLWKTGADGALWAAVSRAVHTPSRTEDGVNIGIYATPTGAPFPSVAVVTYIGNPSIQSEKLIAYELGWRDKLQKILSVDATVFYNDYKNFVTYETGTPYLDPTSSYLIVPLMLDNKAHGGVWGTEVALKWQAAEHWRLNGSFTLLRMHMVNDPGGNDTTVPLVAGSSPRQQWQLHSNHDLSHDVNLDAAVYHVSGLHDVSGVAGSDIPAYTRFDLRLGWNLSRNVELSLAGQNLTSNHHPEFAGNIFQLSSEVPRSVYLKVTFKF